MDDSLLWQHLREAVAADDLIVDGERCADYSEDICGGDVVAAAVARPRDVEALRHVVASATGLGYAIVPRGSGHSYTGGVVPDRERCLVVDLTGLDRVLEVDEVDRWVRVEAGCSWAHLLDVLAPRHLRTPFFGPHSGYRATIGGVLSQSAAFFGSAMHGFSEQSVLGLTVVLADGSVLRTGVGTDEKPHNYSHHVESRWKQRDNKVIWELAIDVYSDDYVDGADTNTPIQLSAGKIIGLMVAYCDNDGSELRENFIGSESVPIWAWVVSGMLRLSLRTAEAGSDTPGKESQTV